MRHAAPSGYWNLLSSGTSATEVFHAEMNKWFRNQPELYISTLILQLRVNQVAKLMVHNAAMYRPLLRYNNQQTLLTALAWKWTFDVEYEWREFSHAPVCLPLRDLMQETRCTLENRNKPRRIIGKKPAALVRIQKKTKPVKRTATKLKRVKIARPRARER